MESTVKMKKISGILFKQKALIAIIAFYIVMSFLSPYFLTATNQVALLLQITVLLFMAIGVTFVIISGDCDLCLGANMCVSGIIAIQLQEYLSLPMIFIVVLLVGLAIGLVNSFIIVYQGANAFITTLGMMYLLRGVALVLTDGKPITGQSQGYVEFGNGTFLGINYITWLAIGLFILAVWVMRSTSLGRNCYAVGGNKSVAEYSGINIKKHKTIVFCISAMSAALAGFCYSAYLNSGSSVYGENTALLINCGVVVGGTPFNGGRGGMIQSLIGIFLFGLLENALMLLNVSSYIQQLVRGIVIVFVIAMDFYSEKRRLRDV